jgi:hypothetical protein
VHRDRVTRLAMRERTASHKGGGKNERAPQAAAAHAISLCARR